MKNVIYVDDDSQARDSYSEILAELFGEDFELHAIEPDFKMENMLERLQKINSIVAYVLDEKLNQLGKADYLGQELAERLRELDPKVPIYLFTAYKDDFSDVFGPAEVEYVIGKEAVSDDKKFASLSSKIRRHHNIYCDIQSERANRLDFLLLKKINGNISKDENDELDSMNFLRTKSINLHESDLAEELEKKINDIDKKLSILEDLIKED